MLMRAGFYKLELQIEFSKICEVLFVSLQQM